jgi:hypothetical protein
MIPSHAPLRDALTGDNVADALSGPPQWIVEQVAVPMRRARLGVSEQGANRGQRQAFTDKKAREGMAEVMNAKIAKAGW